MIFPDKELKSKTKEYVKVILLTAVKQPYVESCDAGKEVLVHTCPMQLHKDTQAALQRSLKCPLKPKNFI